MSPSEKNFEAELKLILHRLDELSREQRSGLGEIKTRIAHIEESQQRMAVFQGRAEQRLETLEEAQRVSSSSNEGMTTLAKTALGLVAAALGVIGTLAAKLFGA